MTFINKYINIHIYRDTNGSLRQHSVDSEGASGLVRRSVTLLTGLTAVLAEDRVGAHRRYLLLAQVRVSVSVYQSHT